jgi:hypothetical protein
METNYTVEYFGVNVVERAIANYFCMHGVTEEVRDRLMEMTGDPDQFFQMVCDFIEK